jgi:pyruvate/2-oxoglutarate dehydrogenase complex dihydrolipoamide dehydrogenase (E3) component
LLNADVQKVTGENGQSIELTVSSAGQTQMVKGTHILAATGRRPNTSELNVGMTGVELTPQGYVKVDERLQTTASGVWAIGEVAGSPQFTHISYDDFRVIRENLAGRHRVTSGRQVAYVLFTDPEVAHVGLSETEARKSGIWYRLFKVPMAAVLRTRTLGETEGFLKALVADDDRILGFTAFGVDAGELLSGVQIAMLGNMPYTTIRDAVLTHPTLAEGLVVLFSSTPTASSGS